MKSKNFSAPTNYNDLQFLSQPATNSPPKPSTTKKLKPPPTTNVAKINNDDFFDLL
jgi:hypothetical protein